MASITKTKNGYRAQVYVRGVRDSRSFRLKRDAEIWAYQREAELWEDAGKAPGERHTLKQMLEKYRNEVTPTKRGNAKERIRIDAMINAGLLPINKPVQDCTPEALGRWRDIRLTQVSAGSVLREFSTLSAIFETARMEWGWIKTNPVRDVRKPREPDHRNITITRPQFKAMLREFGYSPMQPIRTVSQACAVAFLVASRTGMRAGELCGLTWDRVSADYCQLPITKSDPRDVPLSDKAIKLINKMRGFDKNLVFGIKPQTLDALFRRTRERAGLSGFTFHDTRHTAATWLVDSGKVDVLTLCKIFGWKNVKQALTYFNPKASAIAKRLSGPAKRGQSQ